MHKNLLLLLIICFSLTLFSCQDPAPRKLPVLGFADEGKDYTIPPFGFLDQDSSQISEAWVKGKIYIADFFFTSCPDICPKMNQQMLRVHDEYLEDAEVLILSHTLDPKRDTVATLRSFAKGLGINNDKWKMLTSPDPDYVFDVCKSYMVAAGPDESLMGGIFHSGKFVLVDQKSRVRGFYEGTDPKEVDKLMEDILTLKNEAAI